MHKTDVFWRKSVSINRTVTQKERNLTNTGKTCSSVTEPQWWCCNKGWGTLPDTNETEHLHTWNFELHLFWRGISYNSRKRFLLWLMDIMEAECWTDVWITCCHKHGHLYLTSCLWCGNNETNCFKCFPAASIYWWRRIHTRSCSSLCYWVGGLKCVFLLVAVGWLKCLRLSESFTPDVADPAEPQEGVGADRPPGPILFLVVVLCGRQGLCLSLHSM